MGTNTRDNLILADEAFRIRGAVFDVYRAKGAGFLEAVYQECLAIEFEILGGPLSSTVLPSGSRT